MVRAREAAASRQHRHAGRLRAGRSDEADVTAVDVGLLPVRHRVHQLPIGDDQRELAQRHPTGADLLLELVAAAGAGLRHHRGDDQRGADECRTAGGLLGLLRARREQHRQPRDLLVVHGIHPQ